LQQERLHHAESTQAKNAITLEMHDLCRVWADFRDADDADVAIPMGTGGGVAMQTVLNAEPIDAQQELQCNMAMKVVPHEQVLQEAEAEELLGQFFDKSERPCRNEADRDLGSCTRSE
jgi:hypothetical protein